MVVLSKIEYGRIPGDSKYRFRTRARNVLDKWGHEIQDEAADLHWTLKPGKRSLVYLPKNDRKSLSSKCV